MLAERKYLLLVPPVPPGTKVVWMCQKQAEGTHDFICWLHCNSFCNTKTCSELMSSDAASSAARTQRQMLPGCVCANALYLCCCGRAQQSNGKFSLPWQLEQSWCNWKEKFPCSVPVWTEDLGDNWLVLWSFTVDWCLVTIPMQPTRFRWK